MAACTQTVNRVLLIAILLYLALVLLNEFNVFILDLCCLRIVGYVYTYIVHVHKAMKAEDEINKLYGVVLCTNKCELPHYSS